MMLIEHHVQAGTARHVDNLLDPCEPERLDIAVAVDILEPGNGDADTLEARRGDAVENLLIDGGIAPIGLLRCRPRISGAIVQRIKRVAEVPAGAEVGRGYGLERRRRGGGGSWRRRRCSATSAASATTATGTAPQT